MIKQIRRKRVYLAAAWIKGGDALVARDQLVRAGIDVTSRWLERVKGNTDPAYDYTKDPNYTAPDAKVEATKDIEDIEGADAVVVLNSAKSEGKAVEQGVALMLGIPIIVVGERSNTFQYFDPPKVTVVANMDEAIEVLRG